MADINTNEIITDEVTKEIAEVSKGSKNGLKAAIGGILIPTVSIGLWELAIKPIARKIRTGFANRKKEPKKARKAKKEVIEGKMVEPEDISEDEE